MMAGKNKIIILMLSILIVLALSGVAAGMRKQKGTDYEALLAEEITELESCYGIRELSQAPAYVNQDGAGICFQTDFSEYAEIHKFQGGVSFGGESRLRFGTKRNGVLYLGQAVFKDSTFYGILYNTQNGQHTITEYTELIYEQGDYVDGSNLPWHYTDGYLANEQDDRLYLFTLRSVSFPNVKNDYLGEFALWAKETYRSQGDIYRVDIMQDVSDSNITDDIETFRQMIENDPTGMYEYRYMESVSNGICAVCYSGGVYDYIVWLLKKDWFEMQEYQFLYVKDDDNGDTEYILSNMEESFAYQKSYDFDDSMEQYRYILPK